MTLEIWYLARHRSWGVKMVFLVVGWPWLVLRVTFTSYGSFPLPDSDSDLDSRHRFLHYADTMGKGSESESESVETCFAEYYVAIGFGIQIRVQIWIRVRQWVIRMFPHPYSQDDILLLNHLKSFISTHLSKWYPQNNRLNEKCPWCDLDLGTDLEGRSDELGAWPGMLTCTHTVLSRIGIIRSSVTKSWYIVSTSRKYIRRLENLIDWVEIVGHSPSLNPVKHTQETVQHKNDVMKIVHVLRRDV